MSETKHTPGPLFAECGFVFRELDRAEPWTTRPPVADCDIMSREEGQANATLYAAAPDLLDALRLLHPAPGVWRTPTDDQAAQIEAVMLRAAP